MPTDYLSKTKTKFPNPKSDLGKKRLEEAVKVEADASKSKSKTKK